MTDGDVYPPGFQHFVKPVEKLRLLFGAGQIAAVCRGEMGEKTLGTEPRKIRNAGALVRRRRRGLEADAAHARVQGKVEGGLGNA